MEFCIHLQCHLKSSNLKIVLQKIAKQHSLLIHMSQRVRITHERSSESWQKNDFYVSARIFRILNSHESVQQDSQEDKKEWRWNGLWQTWNLDRRDCRQRNRDSGSTPSWKCCLGPLNSTLSNSTQSRRRVGDSDVAHAGPCGAPRFYSGVSSTAILFGSVCRQLNRDDLSKLGPRRIQGSGTPASRRAQKEARKEVGDTDACSVVGEWSEASM